MFSQVRCISILNLKFKSLYFCFIICAQTFSFSCMFFLSFFLTRLLFTDSDIVMLGKWGFDGLEDWEYPGIRRGSPPGDNKISPFSVKSCWTPLRLKQQKLESPAFFLTRAVAAGYATIDKAYTPNAKMADHSVGARDELHESEVSQSFMFCFDNFFPDNSCFVVDLFCFISLWQRVAVFLNATRRDRNLSPFTSKRK